MLKKARKERLIWIDITITLLALELMSYFYYGIRSLVLGGVCVAVSLLTEMISLRLMHKSFTADNLMCTSDALIISLMMPAVMDYKIAAIACVFAVTAAKNIFGGRKNMIFSPAAAAYVFMLASWGKKLLLYPEPHVRTGLFDMPDGLVSSASYVYNTTGKMDYTDFEILLGNFSGAAGSASILLLIVAAVILIFRRDISAGAFIGTILGTGFLAYIMPVSASLTAADSVKYSLVTNMVLLRQFILFPIKESFPNENITHFFMDCL